MRSKSHQLLAVILVLSLMGMAPGSARASNPPPATLMDPVTIRWFTGMTVNHTPQQVAALQQIVTDFNAAHPGIQLVLEVANNATAVNQLRAEIAAGNPPDIVGPIGITGSNLFYGHWLDLQPLVTANSYDLGDFDPGILDTLQESGEGLIGIPLSVFPSFIFYNKSLFDQAGLAYPPHQYGQLYTDPVHGGPWTIEKLEEIGRLLTHDTGGYNANDPAFDPASITQFGYLTQFTDLRGEATLFGPGSFVDANGDAQIPANWQAAFDWYYAGTWQTHFIPNNPSFIFSSGNLAMAHLHLWHLCCLGDLPNWDIAAVPGYNGTATAKLHTDTLRIYKTTPHPTEAFEVYSYLVGDAAPALMEALGAFGGMPARHSLRPGYLAQLSTQYPGVDWQVAVDGLGHIDHPSHEGVMPNFQKANERIQSFQDLYRGTPGLNLEVELDQLQTDLQTIFHTPALQFSPVTPNLGVGGSTTVLIDLNQAANLYGYQFQVNYDATKVSATGMFANSFFSTAGGVIPPGWDASCAAGVCQFAVTRLNPAPAISGSGSLAQITFTGLAPGTVPLTFSGDVLSDRDGTALSHTADTTMLTVYGFATLSGTVNLQGRASPGDATGTVTLTDLGGVFSPTVATIAANGTWTATNVPVMPGDSTYQLDAAHSLYLGSQLSSVSLTPGNSYPQAATKLKGGDANNDGVISIGDLSCIGGDFGGTPGACGGTGSSDINADGMVNILDLVLAGGNYGLATPQPW